MGVMGRSGVAMESLYALPSLERRPFLNVYALANKGALTPRVRSCVSWPHSTATATILAEPTQFGIAMDWRDEPAQVISLVREPRLHGAEQLFFLCPDCRRRTHDLYLTTHEQRFTCRTCGGWPYLSRRELRDPARIAGKLRMRLGASPALADPLPPRPKDPRAAREYDGIVLEIAAYEELAIKRFRNMINGLERYARTRGRLPW